MCKGNIHWPRGQLKGEWIIQMPILLHESGHEGEGVKNIQNCDHVVYEWPPKDVLTQNYESFVEIMVLKRVQS